MASSSWSASAACRRSSAARKSIASNCRKAASSAACGCRPGLTATCSAVTSTAVSSSHSRSWEAPVADVDTSATVNTALPAIPADAVIIVPVRNLVLFPNTVAPVTVGRPKSIAAAQQAVREQRQIGVLMQRDESVADPAGIDMHRVGTIANIVRYVTAPDGSHHLVCQGEKRFQVVEFLGGWPFLVARIREV